MKSQVWSWELAVVAVVVTAAIVALTQGHGSGSKHWRSDQGHLYVTTPSGVDRADGYTYGVQSKYEHAAECPLCHGAGL